MISDVLISILFSTVNLSNLHPASDHLPGTQINHASKQLVVFALNKQHRKF